MSPMFLCKIQSKHVYNILSGLCLCCLVWSLDIHFEGVIMHHINDQNGRELEQRSICQVGGQIAGIILLKGICETCKNIINTKRGSKEIILVYIYNYREDAIKIPVLDGKICQQTQFGSLAMCQ